MYSYRKLPASNRLEGLNDGILDTVKSWFGMPDWVRSYWAVVKSKVNEIIATGPKISTHQQRIAIAQQTLLKRGDTRAAAALDDELRKIQDDLNKWWKVKGYIDSYMPQWAMLDQNVTVQPTSGVGAVPFILAGMALTALAYVVNVGMALVQDYAFKSQLTQAVIDQKISTGQMADILSIPKNEGMLEKVVSSVGLGVGIGIPTVLIVGGGLYLAFTTGMLDTVLKMVGLKGGQSQASGG